LGIAIAATLGLAAAFMRRKRAAEATPIDDDELYSAEGRAEPWDSAAAQSHPEDATVARIRPVLDEATGPVSVLDAASATPPAEPVAEAEEDDPLSDINVYLAYERFDEAEQVVKQAIAAQPSAHKLKLKLLEVYYAAGNNAAFEQYAAELQSAVGGTGPLWHSALAMWQAMSPERALFAPGGEPAPAASTGREFIDISDISAIGETHKLPPSALGEMPAVKTQPATTGTRRTLDALDLDFSGFGTESQVGGERMVDLSSGHELEWDGGGIGTAEPEAATGAVVDLGAGDDEDFDVLDLTMATALHHPAILTGTTPHASTRSGATADTVPGNELRFRTVPGAGAGLDVDLSLGSGTADRGASIEATSEVTSKLPPGTEPGRLPAPIEVSVLGETIDLGAPEWSQASLRVGSARSTAADGDPGSSMDLEPRDRTVEDSVEFDLGDIDLEVVESKTSEPIATAGVLGSSSFDVTQVSSIDLSLGSFGTIEPGDGLEPVDFAVDEGFSSDVDVKLNLAKAYIELGDAEGARAILQEVTAQGTAAERDEAAQLLAQIA
jgi:pilus assembly protein FimV